MNRAYLCLALLAGTLSGGRLVGQDLVTPAPLLGEPPPLAMGATRMEEGRGDRALETGFPATAAAIYRQLLAGPTPPDEARWRLTLSLVTALFDAGDIKAAEELLHGYDGPQNARYRLRAGLLAAHARRWPQVKTALDGTAVDELAPADRGWWHYLRAQAADAEPNLELRRAEFAAALQNAVSAAQRAKFQMEQELVMLRTGQTNEAQLAVFRSNMEKFAGQPTGYEATRFYAAALSAAGRRGEAITVLQRTLAVIPANEQRTANQLQLLLGYIAGEGSEQGRRAFGALVRQAAEPDIQRTALYLLARGAATAPARELLRRDLTQLINAPAPHPIIEDLLLVRASLCLADRQYAGAEEDARTLLERFPGSALKPAALGVRLTVAWEGKRYRTAADVIAQLRALLAPGPERSELGVLLAESFFRAGADAAARGIESVTDFRNAAAAYEAALKEAPAVEPPGTLIFQRVLAEIRAERLDVAGELLDEAAANPAFDPVSRWQAEWNLAKEREARDQTAAAFARVDGLLADGGRGVPADLRVRLMWLRAKLSYDNDQPDVTLRLLDEILAAVKDGGELAPAVKTIVASNATLLKARASFRKNADEEGTKVLLQLREEFRGSQAAIYSYIVQATRLAQRGNLAQAQATLTELADQNRESEFAPQALYDAALIAEQQGLERNLREANNLLDRISRDYPNDGLRFYALRKQGDLLRKMDDFAAARQVYELAVNNYPQHPDVLLAQLALADTMFALGAGSVSNRESAVAMFERLRDLPSAPTDLRVEAGFKWGYALATRTLTGKGNATVQGEDAARAIAVYWSVVEGFLLAPEQAAKLGATGRYWMSKTLLALGQLHEDLGNSAEAQRAYQLIVDQKLSGAGLVRAKLERYRAAEGSAAQ